MSQNALCPAQIESRTRQTAAARQRLIMARMEQIAKKGRRGDGGGGISRFLPPLEETPRDYGEEEHEIICHQRSVTLGCVCVQLITWWISGSPLHLHHCQVWLKGE